MDLNINYASKMFTELLGEEALLGGKSFTKLFKIIRPKKVNDWTELVRFSYSLVFEITNNIPLANKNKQKVIFKGQIKLVNDLKSVIFIGKQKS